jgi:hypothetical protein
MKDAVCGRFNEMHLHDSKLVSFSLLRREMEGETYDDICLDLDLITGVIPPASDDPWKRFQFKTEKRELTFKDCLFFETNLNLLAKKCVADMIDRSGCKPSCKSKVLEGMEGIGGERLQRIDLEDYIQFNIVLTHPAGTIGIVAKEYCLSAKSKA